MKPCSPSRSMSCHQEGNISNGKLWRTNFEIYYAPWYIYMHACISIITLQIHNMYALRLWGTLPGIHHLRRSLDIKQLRHQLQLQSTLGSTCGQSWPSWPQDIARTSHIIYLGLHDESKKICFGQVFLLVLWYLPKNNHQTPMTNL